MKNGMFRTGVALWLMLVMAGCEGGAPTGPGGGPGNSSLTGTWTGPVIESPGGAGSLRLVIDQREGGVSGTFGMVFPDPSFDRNGDISGLASSSSAQLSARFVFGCSPEQLGSGFLPLSVLTATWSRSGDVMKGRYDGYGCVGNIEGDFELTLKSP